MILSLEIFTDEPEMISTLTAKPRPRIIGQLRINKVIASTVLALGIILIGTSLFYTSMISSVVGLCLTFWGAILLYVTPSKYVLLEILNAAAYSTLLNVERMLTDLDGKGIYLPPRCLKNFESSLVFVSQKNTQDSISLKDVSEEKLVSTNPQGIFLVPPGLALSRLFETALGASFTRVNLDFVRDRLPKLLVEELEIAENVKVETQNNMVNIEVTNHIFNELCQETRKLRKTHEQIGCTLTSAIACALAKSTGKLITIEKEEQTSDGRTTTIQYGLLEG
jgi:hypothetical protein